MAQFNSKNKSSRVARRWFTDFDINMKNHPQTKDMVLKYDLQAVTRSIRNLILTNHYERPFKPSLGANLRAALFELDMVGSRVVEQNIVDQLNRYEPRADIKNVFVSTRGNDLNVTLHYVVGNDPRPHELELILERIR